MPMLYVRSNADDISSMQDVQFSAFFLIAPFSGQDKKYLASAVFMPVGSGSGFKRYIGEGRVEDVVFGA